jgi:hypothetical protein
MAYINKEHLIGWLHEDNYHFLCDKCFWEEENIERNDFKPVMKNEIRPEEMYVCDVCGEKSTED